MPPGSASIEFRPERPFSLYLTDTFTRSTNPATVAPEAGIATGRFTSTSNAITPAATYQFFTPRTSGDISYTFTRFLVEGSPERDAHSPRLGITFAYSPTIRFVSSTGLLFLQQEDGSEEVTLASSTRYEQQFKQGSFSIGYERNAGVAGLTGVTSVTQSLTTAASYQPIRFLTLAVDASLAETESSGSSSTHVDSLTFLGPIRISYQLLRWLSVEASAAKRTMTLRSPSRALLEVRIFSARCFGV